MYKAKILCKIRKIASLYFFNTKSKIIHKLYRTIIYNLSILFLTRKFSNQVFPSRVLISTFIHLPNLFILLINAYHSYNRYTDLTMSSPQLLNIFSKNQPSNSVEKNHLYPTLPMIAILISRESVPERSLEVNMYRRSKTKILNKIAAFGCSSFNKLFS